MSQEDHKPRRGDRVWDGNKSFAFTGTKGHQPNGYITSVDWSDRMVNVHFHDGSDETYTIEELDEAYSHDMGGMYLIYPQTPVKKG